MDYSSFDYSKIFDDSNEGIPEFYNATEIIENVGMNNILDNIVNGFISLWNDLVNQLQTQGNKRRLRASPVTRYSRKLTSLGYGVFDMREFWNGREQFSTF